MTTTSETNAGTSTGSVTGSVAAGRDFVGRDSHHDQSSSAQVHVGNDSEWMTAQITIITTQLTQVNQRLKKLDQIDEALIGNRLYGERGLVEDVRRLWAVVLGIVIVLALLGIVEAAQWVLLWRLMALL